MTYLEKLHSAQTRNQSWLCVGIDPQPERLPVEAVSRWDEPLLPFGKAIIDATKDFVCAFKPNLGFFLQWGASGIIALERLIAYVPDDIPVIVDCKTGDIGHTQSAWARGLLDEMGADALTVNPYVGAEAVLPVLKGRPDKAVYLLARTSNPTAPQFQGDLATGTGLAATVIGTSQTWLDDEPDCGSLGYVVGATYPEELGIARQMAPNASFLIPGIGAQGGNLTAAVAHGPAGSVGPVISVSRGVIYASAKLDFAEAARNAARDYRDQINALRPDLT